MVVWANQSEAILQASEARAGQAELRVATAEAQVTAHVQAQAATATTRAYVGGPEAAVDRSLGVLLAAERPALARPGRRVPASCAAVVRPEVEHLLWGGLHLGGQSSYELAVLTTAMPAPDVADVRTRERWTYDERSADDHRARCLIETSEQTYTLQRAGTEWHVAAIEFGSSSRTDCPSR